MKIIINNPFRVLGLFSNAKASTINRNLNKLKMFADADQDFPDDLNLASFPSLGTFKRSKTDIEYASSYLNLDHDKMIAALFWFFEGNPITDEPAFDELRASNIQGASDIWSKMVQKGINEKSYSAFQNLSNLYLLRAFKGSFADINTLKQAIKYKIELLESDYAQKFISSVTDTNFKINNSKVQELFLKEVIEENNTNKKYNEHQIIEIVQSLDFAAKNDFLKGFVQKPIEQIEKNIEEAKKKRKSNKSDALKAGNDLYSNTSKDLNQLKDILGGQDLKYSNIADKVANEILQCGVEYFINFRDSGHNPGFESLSLIKKAQLLACGTICKQRCEENINNLNDWNEGEEERKKQKLILADVEKLGKLIDDSDNTAISIVNAKKLLTQALPALQNIKTVLGVSNELYLGISTRIAADAQGMYIDEINNLQNKLSIAKLNASKKAILENLKTKIDEAWDVITIIGAMDINSDFKKQYERNKSEISTLRSQLSLINLSEKPAASSNNKGDSSNKGCLWILGLIFLIGFITVMNKSSYDDDNNQTYSHINQNGGDLSDGENVGNTLGDFSPESSDQNSSGVSSGVNSDQTDDFVFDDEIPSKPVESEWKNNQLSNGDSPLDDCFGDGEFEGLASLTIENGSNSEAIVCLYDVDIDRTIRNSYVQKASNYKIKRIPQGNYLIRVFYGNDWNPNLSNPCNSGGYFESDTNFSEFDGMQFFQNNSEGYTTATVTLYAVQGGNASTSAIDESTFFKK